MRQIRKIDEPDKLLAFGYVDSGGLGKVPDGFEEIESPLPQQYSLIKLKGKEEKIIEKAKQISASARLDIYLALTVIEKGDTETAIAIIQESGSLSETVKQKITGYLTETVL